MSKAFITFTSIMTGASFVLVSGLAMADQAAWIEKKDADAGAALINVGQEVRDYCAPCGDKGYAVRSVTSVNVAKAGSTGSYWEVRINGRGVDLAYEYILVNGHWTNVAMLVGLPVSGVPAELPSGLSRK